MRLMLDVVPGIINIFAASVRMAAIWYGCTELKTRHGAVSRPDISDLMLKNEDSTFKTCRQSKCSSTVIKSHVSLVLLSSCLRAQSLIFDTSHHPGFVRSKGKHGRCPRSHPCSSSGLATSDDEFGLQSLAERSMREKNIIFSL